MYWLNGVASQLSLANALRGNKDNQSQDADKHFRQPLDIVSVEPSPHASLFVSCTSTAVYLWSVKVKWFLFSNMTPRYAFQFIAHVYITRTITILVNKGKCPSFLFLFFVY